MKTNPYDVNGYYQPPLPKPRQQSQSFYQQAYAPARDSQPLNAQPRPQMSQPPQVQVAKPKGPKPMPKARALAIVHTCKQWLVAASLASFLTFGGLAAFHQIGTTASKTTSTTASTTSSTSSQKSSKNILKQSGGNNVGSTSTPTGSTSSSSSTSTSSGSASSSGTGSSSTGPNNGSSSSSSTPVSGTSVS